MKRQKTNWLKRRERSDTYLTCVCRLLLSVESLERIYIKMELSAKTVAFISRIIRLIIMLAGAIGVVGRRAVVVEGNRMRLMDILETAWIEIHAISN